MMAMAVAVMSFAALLLAVNTLLLDGDDELLGDSVELGDFLVAQATEDVLGGFLVRRNALLGDLLALVGQLNSVRALALGLFDGDLAVALSLLHDALELATVDAELLHEIALGSAVVLKQELEQCALAALEALRAVLVESEAGQFACLFQLSKRLHCVSHGGSFFLFFYPLYPGRYYIALTQRHIRYSHYIHRLIVFARHLYF